MTSEDYLQGLKKFEDQIEKCEKAIQEDKRLMEHWMEARSDFQMSYRAQKIQECKEAVM